MGFSAESGNFEGRSRAHGGFGNETGQSDRRGRSGDAEQANRNALNRATTLSGPRGPFKSPVYDPTLENLTTLGRMVGPMLASPGIGFAAPLARSIISGDVYGAFGRPTGWSNYSPRDVDPMGSNPRGNTGGQSMESLRNTLTPWQQSAILAELLRRQQAMRPKTPAVGPVQPQHFRSASIGDGAPGLPAYGTVRPGYEIPLPRAGKAAGYGGAARVVPIAHPTSSY